MVVGLVRKKIGKHFDGEMRFVRGMIEGPKQVGAILPTSSVTAKVMARVINPASGLKVLELGPGTGAITKAILIASRRSALSSVEYSTPFYNHLAASFPCSLHQWRRFRSRRTRSASCATRLSTV